MGKFLQNHIEIVQLGKDDIINGKPVSPSAGIFQTLEDLTYLTNGGLLIQVPAGYITDGYSKPIFTEWLVGGRFEDDVRPAILHDYLCQFKGFHEVWMMENTKTTKYIGLAFKKVNDIFYDAMIDVGINKFKAKIMRFAVNFNPQRW